MSLIRELKRRNVFRVTAAYLITAWLVMQVGDTMVPALRLPDWSASLLAFFLILGFPIAIFFAWAFELTPEGLKRDEGTQGQNENRVRADRKLNHSILVVMTLALGYFVLDKFVFTHSDLAETTVSSLGSSKDEQQKSPEISSQSIAVLPFVNMSSDPEQEYFSDGLTEELLSLLAGIKELKVAARTSSFYYKDKVESVPLTEIAKQLEVAHVLEGSVRKSGSTIRITAQLIKADDGFHLWSETCDRELDDIFAIQDEIAAAVTSSLKITLLGEAPRTKVLNTESYELTMQARFLFKRRKEGDLQRALELFERATQLDPDNAAAWVGLSPLYLFLFDPPDNNRSLEAAKKAVELSPENPEARIRFAGALSRAGDQTQSRQEFQKGVQLGQDNPYVLSSMAGMAGFFGDLDKAIELLTRAVALDPLYIVNLGNLSSYLVLAGRIDEANDLAMKVLNLEPTSPQGLESLAEIRLLQGAPKEALKLMQQITEVDRPGTFFGRHDQFEAMIHFSLGDESASDDSLNRFKQKYADENPSEIAGICAWCGQTDEAFGWLEHALEIDPNRSFQETWSPYLESLHQDARWQHLMTRWVGTPNWLEEE